MYHYHWIITITSIINFYYFHISKTIIIIFYLFLITFILFPKKNFPGASFLAGTYVSSFKQTIQIFLFQFFGGNIRVLLQTNYLNIFIPVSWQEHMCPPSNKLFKYLYSSFLAGTYVSSFKQTSLIHIFFYYYNTRTSSCRNYLLNRLITILHYIFMVAAKG